MYNGASVRNPRVTGASMGALAAALRARGPRELDMAALARVATFQEVVLADLGAGMLEPLLAMSAADAPLGARAAIVNTCQLLGLAV
ncbi:MAG: hypothetical protein VX017_11260, partial [Pseudomonadota bacterium]|nr:hypothetical protein [Pseudomonadota bacterium]